MYSLVLMIGAVVPTVPSGPGSVSDKVWHALAYGVQAGLLFWAVFSFVGRPFPAAVIAVTGTGLFGVLTEVVQLFVPYRGFEVGDLAADLIGAIGVVGLCWVASIVGRGLRWFSGAVDHRGA